LLELAFWKIHRLTEQRFRFRSGCFLECRSIATQANGKSASALPEVNIRQAIAVCQFSKRVTRVYYPAADLFKPTKDDGEQDPADGAQEQLEEEDTEGGEE